jgi:hypothetical protein
MKRLLFFLVFAATQVGIAQNITPIQANLYADKLYQKAIIGKDGYKQLKKAITETQLGEKSYSDMDGSLLFGRGITIEGILGFCEYLFMQEGLRRTLVPVPKEIKDYVIPEGFDEEAYFAKFKQRAPYNLEEKIDTENPDISESYLNYDYGKLRLAKTEFIHPTRSTLGKTRERTRKDLNEIGLLDPKVFKELEADSVSRNEVDMVGLAGQRTVYYTSYTRNKEEQLALLRRLAAQKILTEEDYQKIVASYQPYELKEKEAFLPYCEPKINIDEADYKGDIQRFFEMVFAKIRQKLLPEFNYQNLKATLKTDSVAYNTDADNWYIDLSFEASGRRFEQRLYYGFTQKGTKIDTEKAPNLNDYFCLKINQYLADMNSEYRLYIYPPHIPFDTMVTSIYRFNQAQRDAWGNDFYSLPTLIHDNRFNTQGMERIIADYKRLELFTHLTDTEINEGINSLKDAQVGNFQSIITVFPHVTVGYYGDGGWGGGSIPQALQELATASRGGFQPENVQDNYEKVYGEAAYQNPKARPKYFEMSFEFKGKKYQLALPREDHTASIELLALVNQALSENKAIGRFYEIPQGDSSYFIFLNQTQYNYLKQNQAKLFEVND